MVAASFGVDLDGTLITCRDRHLQAFEIAKGEQGWATSLEAARFWALKQSGRTTAEAARALGASADLAGRLAERWIAIIEDDSLLELDRPRVGSLEGLARIHRAGRKAVVITARQRQGGLEAQLARLGISDLVDAVAVVSPADAPVAKALELRRHECAAMIGDSEVDEAAAARAGVHFAAVSDGQRSPDWWARRGTRIVCDSVPEAVERLLSEVPSLEGLDGR